MLFRIAFIAALVVLSLNISVVFNVEKANPIEKAFVLAAAILMALRGKIDRTLMAFAGVVVFGTLLSAVLTDFAAFSWDLYLRALITLAATLLFLITVPRAADRDVVLITLALVPILQVVLGLAYNAVGLWSMFKADSFGVVRLAGSTIPAFLGATAATGAVAAMAYASQKDMRFLIILAINTVILLLSGARMATAAAALGCAGVLLFGFQRNRAAKYLIIAGGGIAAIAVFPILGQTLLERAGSGSLQGRDLLWSYLSGYTRDYPYFGVGLGAQYTLIPPRLVILTGTVAAHNEYIRLLVEIGMVGGAVFLFGYIGLFLATAASPLCENRGGYMLIVAAFLMYSATDNTFTRFECVSILIVAFYGTSRALGDRPKPKTSEPPPLRPRTLGESLAAYRGRG
jgi:O-antigen ligase